MNEPPSLKPNNHAAVPMMPIESMASQPTRQVRPSEDALVSSEVVNRDLADGESAHSKSVNSEIDLHSIEVEPPTRVPIVEGKLATLSLPPSYELITQLGRGGMGVVYLVRNIESKRIEALKMVLAWSDQPTEQRKRFRQETEAVARLQHPNIVQLYTCGTHAELPYYTMEYCPGGSLASMIAVSQLPFSNAAKLVEQLAQGMHYAHSRNIVHRDLKPGNILLDEHGIPKIADFGLAKLTDSFNSALTASDAAVGTPDYMSPEQASGHSRSVGPPADIWALGAILYRLLTGRPPFVGSNPLIVLSQVVTAEPPAPRTLNRSIPRDLETICLKCLQKDPAKRYSSAEALSADLRAFQEGRTIQARPVGLVRRVWRWCKRNPVLAILSGSIALLLPVATVVALSLAVWALEEAKRADHQTNLTLESKWKTIEAAETAIHAEQAAREQSRLLQLERAELQRHLKRSERLYYASQLSLAQQYWVDGRAIEARQVLASTEPALRGWEYDYLRYRFDHQGQASLVGHSEYTIRVAISSDGSRVVTASKDKTLRVWDTQTRECLLVLRGHKHPVHFVAMTADGKWIVSSDYPTHLKRVPSEIILWDGQTGCEVRRFTGHSLLCQGVGISDDARVVIAAVSYSKLIVWDAQTGQMLRECDAGPQYVTSVGLAADGKTAVSGSKNGVLCVWDVDTGKLRHTFNASEHTIFSVAITPDGKIAASGSGGFLAGMREVVGEIKLWDCQNGKHLAQMPGQNSTVFSIAIARDGKTLASNDQSNVRYWDVQSKRLIATFRGHNQSVYGVAISSDGKQIVSAAQEPVVKLWKTDTLQQNRSVGAANLVTINCLPMTADSKHFLLNTSKQACEIYDITTLRPVRTIQIPDGEFMRAAFVPNRPWLIARITGPFKNTPHSSSHGKLVVWNYQTGEWLAEYNDLPGGLGVLSVLPDGKTLLCGHAGPTKQGSSNVANSRLAKFSAHSPATSNPCIDWTSRATVSFC